MNQDTLWIPAALLGILYPGFTGYLFYSSRLLPERPAVHFSIRGNANGWMTRWAYLLLMFALGTGLSLFQVVMSLMGKPGQAGFHVPHAEYWLAPDRMHQTSTYLIGHSLWLACLALGFFAGLHFMIIRANQKVPPRLSLLFVLLVAGAFAAGVLLWERQLDWHFRNYAP